MKELPIEIDIDRSARIVRFYDPAIIPEGAMREARWCITFDTLFKIIERDETVRNLYTRKDD